MTVRFSNRRLSFSTIAYGCSLLAYAEYSEEEPVSEENEEQEERSDSDSASASDRAASGTPQIQYIDKSLKEAIHTAPLAQLRLLLTNICSKNELAAQLASSHLLVPAQGRLSQKRKAFEKCKNCGMDYNIVTDADKRCIYHPGWSAPNQDMVRWIHKAEVNEIATQGGQR